MAREARGLLWGGLCAGLGLLTLASLAIGSRAVPPGAVIAAFTAPVAGDEAQLLVRALRLPRTLLALGAGAGLGLAGALMQAMTRNPLAEPGLLGVNAGAALAVVLGAAFLGLRGPEETAWLGFAGAGLAGALVFGLGQGGAGGGDPVRLVLAGAGISVLFGAGAALVILNAGLEVLDLFRGWASGTLEGRGMIAARVMGLSLLAGAALALPLAGRLDALAMGRDLGTALGADPRRTWALACLAVMLLAGGATATAGPIGFVGLVAPQLARALAGPASRVVLPLSAGLAAGLLLLADILGRLVARPDELAAGIVVALIGGPVFVQIVRRARFTRA